DREGRVWVPKQKKGLSMYDGRRWYNYTRKDGLPQKCYNVSQDREGNIWVMGKKGISRFNS
ncbi:MAG: regulator, partial [Bacteroidota bacterium]